MLGLLAAAALTYGLLRAAVAEPAHRVARRRARLLRLLAIRPENLTLDQAEDGAVLARTFGTKAQEESFKLQISRLRKQRSK